MDEPIAMPRWKRVLRIILLVTYPIVVPFLPDGWALPSLGVLVGALLVFGIVHWSNRLDDPQATKRRPDAP